MKSKLNLIILLSVTILLASCINAQSRRSDPVIGRHNSYPTIKSRPAKGPVIGGHPPMPAQYRISDPDVRVETIADNLSVPWDMQFTNSGRYLFFTERKGAVNFVDFREEKSNVNNWTTRSEVLHYGEGGLMGLALQPGFEINKNDWIYLCETYLNEDGTPKNRIIRVRKSKKDKPKVEQLISNIPASSIHDGCRLEFGPDGYLYASTGDAGRPERAQNLASLAGKILRMTDTGEPAPGNPFDGGGARPYVYSYGHRNPQGLAWHPLSGELYSSEHGPSGEFGLSGNDEINHIRKGANYGWPDVIGAPGLDRFTDPILLFSHPHLPPAGMDFYTGELFKKWKNHLFVGSLRGELLLNVSLKSGRPKSIQRFFETDFFDGRYGRIRAVTTGPDGSIVFATSNRDGRGNPKRNDDRILKLLPKK